MQNRGRPAKDYRFLDTAQVMRRVSAIERVDKAEAIKKLRRKEKK
jgi:hypothetical protein